MTNLGRRPSPQCIVARLAPGILARRRLPKAMPMHRHPSPSPTSITRAVAPIIADRGDALPQHSALYLVAKENKSSAHRRIRARAIEQERLRLVLAGCIGRRQSGGFRGATVDRSNASWYRCLCQFLMICTTHEPAPARPSVMRRRNRNTGRSIVARAIPRQSRSGPLRSNLGRDGADIAAPGARQGRSRRSIRTLANRTWRSIRPTSGMAQAIVADLGGVGHHRAVGTPAAQ
jgi:hypothetical protein